MHKSTPRKTQHKWGSNEVTTKEIEERKILLSVLNLLKDHLDCSPYYWKGDLTFQ